MVPSDLPGTPSLDLEKHHTKGTPVTTLQRSVKDQLGTVLLSLSLNRTRMCSFCTKSKNKHHEIFDFDKKFPAMQYTQTPACS